MACDQRLAPWVANWVTAAILDGVRGRSADLVAGSSLSDPALRDAVDKPSVVLMRTAAGGDQRLRSAAAAAAAAVWVSDGDARGLRRWLRLDAGPGSKVPVALAMVSAHQVDEADVTAIRAAAGAQAVRTVPPTPTKAALRRLRRLGRSLASAAAAPQRMDSADNQVRRESAAVAAAKRLDALLAEPGVEEFQIRGGDSMLVQRDDGSRELRGSPFASDDELISAVRFLASYSGDRPQRFDELDPRLDARLGTRWRLHAEAQQAFRTRC